MVKKKSKLRTALEMWFWGVVFFWGELFARLGKGKSKFSGLTFDSYQRKMNSLAQPLTDAIVALVWLAIVIANILIVALILIGIYGFVQLFFLRGEALDATDSRWQVEAPVATVIPVDPVINQDWWDEKGIEWIPSFDTPELREQEGVVNMVLLSKDAIRYGTETFQFDESWVQDRPGFIEAVDVAGTAVVVQIDGNQYVLNIYQPLVWQYDPAKVYLVDQERNIWSHEAASMDAVSLEDVRLAVQIGPNADLEIGFVTQ